MLQASLSNLLGQMVYQAQASLGQGLSRTATDSLAAAIAQNVQVLTDAASIVWDCAAGNQAQVVLTASGHTIANPLNAGDGQDYTLEVIQDGTGSRTVSWGSNFVFSGGTAPTLTTTLNKRDIFRFRSSNGGKLYLMSSTLNLV